MKDFITKHSPVLAADTVLITLPLLLPLIWLTPVAYVLVGLIVLTLLVYTLSPDNLLLEHGAFKNEGRTWEIYSVLTDIAFIGVWLTLTPFIELVVLYTLAVVVRTFREITYRISTKDD
jgi:hypothetical protein